MLDKNIIYEYFKNKHSTMKIKNNPIYSGIYGEMMGRPFEFAYHYIDKVINPENDRDIDPDKYALLFPVLRTGMYAKIHAETGKHFPTKLKGLEEFVYGKNSPHSFTDDTVLTVATMEALLEDSENPDFQKFYLKWVKAYPNAGYGRVFREWIVSDNPKPYDSLGNGGAMRVSPVAFTSNDILHVERLAELSARVTHDHPEGIDGAVAVAGAVFLAKRQFGKKYIHKYISGFPNYDMRRKLCDIRKNYNFYSEALKSVPESIICFYEARSSEEAIFNALSLAGDTDTMAMIAGVLAGTYYKDTKDYMVNFSRMRLPEEMLCILDEFEEKFIL